MFAELLKKHLGDFEGSIKIVTPKNESRLRFGGSTDGAGYTFNQKETIDTIDLYYNSRYEKGNRDNNGYRKLFLNKVKFAQNVAEKQTDVDVSNYTFIPDAEEYANKVWFIKRKFIVYTRENNYGELLNDLNKDFSKYGTCVLRRQGKILERIPLRRLKNSQDASSLKKAPEEGGFVIVEHDLSYHQMTKMPDWNTDDIMRFSGTKKVYEMYTMTSKKHVDEDSDSDEEVLTVSYISNEIVREGKDQSPVLFKEEISEVPFEEAHWDRQDGRWLGIGVVEDLFENQIATNMVENLRRKHLTWGAKKIFQSQTESVAKNLAHEVDDGSVLEVGQRGEITPVPTESRNLAEFNQARDVWDNNTEQRSFTFEVSTGESLPSGTPFRLGVVLSNSAARHFDLKREKFGLFLYRSFFSQLMPIFKKQTKEHTLAVANGEEGADFIKESIIRWNTDRRYNNRLLNGEVAEWETIRNEVAEEVDEKPFMFVKVPDKYYDSVQFEMQLDITRQEENTDATMATLVTLYQTLAQQQDPRADKILDQIIALTGENPNKVLGSSTKPQTLASNPDLSGIQNALGQANLGQNAQTQ